MTLIDQLLHDRIDRCSDLAIEQLINEFISDEVSQLQSEYVVDRYVSVDECNGDYVEDNIDDDDGDKEVEHNDEDEDDIFVVHVNDDVDDYYNADPDGDDSDRIDVIYNSTHSSKHHNNDSDNEDNNNTNNINNMMMTVDDNSNFSNEDDEHNSFDQSFNQPINKLYNDNMMIDTSRDHYHDDDNSMMIIINRDVDVYLSDNSTNRIDNHDDDRHDEGNCSSNDNYDEYDVDKCHVNNNIISLPTQYSSLLLSSSHSIESDSKFNSELLQISKTSSPLVAALTLPSLSEITCNPSASDDEALINYDVYVNDRHEEGYFQSPDEIPSRSISRSNSMSRSSSNNLLLNYHHYHQYHNDDDVDGGGGLDHHHHNAIDMNVLFSNYLQNLSIDQCLQNVDRLIKICIIHRRTLFESLVDEMPMNVLTMLYYKNIHHMENNDDNNYNFNDEDNEDDYNHDIIINNNDYRGFNINKIRNLVDDIIKYDNGDKYDENDDGDDANKDDTDDNYVIDNGDDNKVVTGSNNVKDDYGDNLQKLIDLTQSISQLSQSILLNK